MKPIRYLQEFESMTYGEILELNTIKANRFFEREGIRPGGLITLDRIRGVRMTVRKWRLLRRVQALPKR
jgi:hypothetical protein